MVNGKEKLDKHDTKKTPKICTTLEDKYPATVAVVTQGTSRGEEQTGNTHNDNSTQGATVALVTQGTGRWEEQIGNTQNDNYAQGATVAVVTQATSRLEEHCHRGCFLFVPHHDWFPVLLLQLLLLVSRSNSCSSNTGNQSW
jgi:hypothetical protein